MAQRGGFHPDSRLATNGDEVVITAMEWARAQNTEERRRTRRELFELIRERLLLLAALNTPQRFGFIAGG